MPIIERIAGFADELTAIRRDFHEHPELGMEEVRTSGIVAKLLTEWGIETHTEIGKTGVVGVLKGKADGKTCLLYTSPSPRDATLSRMPSSA